MYILRVAFEVLIYIFCDLIHLFMMMKVAKIYSCILVVLFFRDADDAIQDRDGYNYDGYTLRVERPRGIRSGGGGGGGGGYVRGGGGYGRGGGGGGGGGYGRDSFSRDRGSRGGGRGTTGGQGSRRSDYRVLVSGS